MIFATVLYQPDRSCHRDTAAAGFDMAWPDLNTCFRLSYDDHPVLQSYDILERHVQ